MSTAGPITKPKNEFDKNGPPTDWLIFSVPHFGVALGVDTVFSEAWLENNNNL
jgi:hypothetical protein